MALPQENNTVTYADYLKLDEDVQYEVIDGRIYNMSPSQISIFDDLSIPLKNIFREEFEKLVRRSKMEGAWHLPFLKLYGSIYGKIFKEK